MIRIIIRLIVFAARNERTGSGQLLSRVLPLLATLVFVCGAYDFLIYHGLNDAQSMDNAQVARQLVRHEGFSTLFIRPQAISQLHDFRMTDIDQGKPGELFPPSIFRSGVPRILPDTYNAPGYPCLLATWFFLTRPDFQETYTDISSSHMYSPERFIPFLNQGFLLLTAFLVFVLGKRLFDERVAWMSVIVFLGTDLIWHYTLSALSTSFLMFLVTMTLMCVLEVYAVSEACFENEDRSFAPAWGWGIMAAILLATACLTRLHLLVLLVPLFIVLIAMPRPSGVLFGVIALVVLGAIAPWIVRELNVSGNPLGSNFPLFLAGTGNYMGNEIYCGSAIPSYTPILRDAGSKEISGFLWHLQHSWTMLGASPLILLFVASILHAFKRRRARMVHWLLFGAAFSLIAVNNLGSNAPGDVDQWNVLILLYPCMVVIGAAYFFVLLDRLNLQVRLLATLIVFSMVGLGLVPMVLTLTSPSGFVFAYPPYLPPVIKQIGAMAEPDEWITTDMPWATAWYADRPSLWLPDSISDFQNLHDTVCPSGLLILTPVTTAKPLSTYTVGEYKEWFPFVAGLPVPNGFPLGAHFAMPLLNEYYNVWSDRQRWGGQ